MTEREPNDPNGTAEEMIAVNGVDAESGEPLFPPISVSELAAMIREEAVDEAKIKAAKDMGQVSLGPPDGLSLSQVKDVGWALVFHGDEDEAVKQQLLRLYEHRRQQIGDDTKVKVLEYAAETDWRAWLAKYKVGAGSLKPWCVPYYLLLVGGPERIPFDFARDLSMEYAVGLLHFDDPACYGRYVESVIAYETGDAPSRAKEAVFFRTRRDRATKLSADHLIAPLADGVPAQDDEPPAPPVADHQGFATRRVWDDKATGTGLEALFAPPAGVAPPAFLFSATHGVGFIQPDPDQQHTLQGAIKCQDGTKFGAGRLDATAGVQVHGLIAFFFACYSAGTPTFDHYVTRADRTPLQIAEQPFLAALPKALLCHPGGGALACIGHVERAWNYSFSTKRAGDQLIPYQNAVGRILRGLPVGYALTDMRQRYSSLAASVGRTLEEIRKFGLIVNDAQLVADWAARNDAGGYVVVGDPAVCIKPERLV